MLSLPLESMKVPCFVTISELFLVLSAYKLDEIIDDVRNNENTNCNSKNNYA